MTHYTNTNNPIDFPKKKKIPMLEKFAAQSLVEHDGELIFSKEKFAELIVKECISKYDEWAEHSTDKTSFTMARHSVKKHFGVKE
jgi:hypothetical protein